LHHHHRRLPHQQQYTTRDSQGHPILFRRRIGRGGRLNIDRHVRRSSLMSDLSTSLSSQFGGKSRFLSSPVIEDPLSRDEEEDRLARMQERLRYDVQDDLEDDEEAMELNDNWRYESGVVGLQKGKYKAD
jgi:hypothetical protein